MTSSKRDSYRYSVCIKGIISFKEKILLLKNEREEWELPGGKLELNEDPKKCLEREILEEVNIEIKVTDIIDSWVYTIIDNKHVLIVTYACSKIKSDNFQISNEHKEGKWFTLEEIKSINMPTGYKRSIKTWSEVYN